MFSLKGLSTVTFTWYQAPLIERVVSFFKAKLGEPQKAGENKGGNL